MPKIGVSAPEILILREIHQGDNEPVVEITPMGSNKKPGVNAAERDRLNSTYGPKIVERLFSKYGDLPALLPDHRSEEHTSELQSLMRISYAVFCLKKKKKNNSFIILIIY